jgi:VWFA-related protein
MKTRLRRCLTLAFLAGLQATAQQEYRLRVTVDLVQVDATVTDAQGNPVPDLKAGDFRVLLDGNQQYLKYCNYIRLSQPPEPPIGAGPPPLKPATVALPAQPAQPIKREHVRRTIVLFVGDLLTSAESIPAIRAGLKKFVEQQVQPGDLVAIVRSSAGLGALQDFTPDKSMLLAAVDHVAWTPHAIGTGGASAYEAIGQPSLQSIGPLDIAQLDKIDSVERATLATTASLLRVVRAMADLPGRKSVILLSDALRLTSPNEMDPAGNPENGTGAFLGPIYQSMRLVVDESVRAGVVVYAIDTRGLSSLRALASDRLKPPGADGAAGNSAPVLPGDWTTSMTGGRRSEYRDAPWGAMFVSSQTGGFMITESNRIEAGLERVMADQRGYYLLGFQPPAETMRPDRTGRPDFHRLKVEVLRPGLKVRSHAGFFGVGDEESPAAARPELQLLKSLESPFQSSEIHLEVETSYLGARSGYFLRATLYIDGNDVAFQGPPIHRTGVLHVILRAFNATGGTLEGGIDQMRRIDLNEEGYQRAQQYGLIYTTLLPVAKSGPYQVRAACRDQTTGKIGTGGDFVSIPAPKGSGLRLSGIVFQHALGTDDHVVPAAGPNSYSAGQSARFAFQIASGGAQSKTTQLAMRTRLFRDGVEVWNSAAMPVETDAKKAPSFFARGILEVPKRLDPGKYMVRLDIFDKARPDTVSAWQWARLTVQ